MGLVPGKGVVTLDRVVESGVSWSHGRRSPESHSGVPAELWVEVGPGTGIAGPRNVADVTSGVIGVTRS